MNDRSNISPEILDIIKLGIKMAKNTITKNEATLKTFIKDSNSSISLDDIGKIAAENVELKEQILLGVVIR